MPYAPDSSSFRQPQLRAPQPVAPAMPNADARIRLDRITAAPLHYTEGQVVGSDRTPKSRAEVLFVNAERKGDRQTVTADHWGRFRASLASGTWLVYVKQPSGRLIYQQKVEVSEGKPSVPITLVSR